MMKLIGMRGVPGSGKSKKAGDIRREYLDEGWNVQIFSTDDFWGEPYSFVQSKIGQAHLWNQHRALNWMIDAYAEPGRHHLLVIDNTNITAWELKSYVKPAVKLGFAVEIVEPGTEWAFDAQECAKRNVHGVPEATIVRMLERWEKGLTVDKCL